MPTQLADMLMEDPKPTFAYLVSQIKERYPNFAYIHVVEPRVDGVEVRDAIPTDWNNDFLRDIWSPRPFISAGGFDLSSAKELADTKGDLVAFGRKFIANVSRFRMIWGSLTNDLSLSLTYLAD